MPETSSGDRIRVVLVDDHPIALAGIRVGLSSFRDIDLIAEALGGEAGLERISALQPDIAVIDVHLPDIDGLEVAARASVLSPATRIIITSGDLNVATQSRATQLGVAGFFPKSGAVQRLALLIRSIHQEGLDAADEPAALASV